MLNKINAFVLGADVLADIATGKNSAHSHANKAALDLVSGTNTGDQTSISGNATTATMLATARNINGVAFNGTADITVLDVTAAHIAGEETFTGGKAFSKGAVFAGNDLAYLPTGIGDYVAAYYSTTYSVSRLLGYNGTAYRPLSIGSMPTAGLFSATFQTNGNVNFGYSVIAAGTVTGSNLSGTNTGDQNLSALAPLVSPTFTGVPAAPTAAAATNTTQLATTAFVQAALGAGGYGDMMKSTYDTTNNGIVDNAEKVGGLKLTYGATTPTSPASGDLWVNTNF
jgi:hypothetical protein